MDPAYLCRTIVRELPIPPIFVRLTHPSLLLVNGVLPLSDFVRDLPIPRSSSKEFLLFALEWPTTSFKF
ncbi:Hypothetical protein FKW44_007718 [Caligus rogercresseyi]|uniref:Uncharacterized protein n=1 Tax=Caligus rogercresseyi TaxID=217165 RepID=A0A7T8KF50_CALRO|nr:Hypothetical protein FKW44_007718 [Caligus rogercresseyi]